MPYVPTNCWPRNCAVERTNNGYHFLGTTDKYDYINNVYLNLYSKNDFKNPVVIVNNKEQKIFETSLMNEEGYVGKDLVNSTLPPYTIENSLINLQLSPEEDQELETLKIETDDPYFQVLEFTTVEKNKDHRYTTTEAQILLFVPFRIKNNNEILKEQKIKIELPKRSDAIVTGDMKEDTYLSYSQTISIIEPLTISIEEQEAVSRNQYNTIEGGYKGTANFRTYYKFSDGSTLRIYRRVLQDKIPVYYKIQNLILTYKISENKEINLNLNLLLNAVLENPWDWEYVSFAIGTTSSGWDKGATNRTEFPQYETLFKDVNFFIGAFDTLNSYLLKNSEYYWNFSLFGDKYDVFIGEGVLEIPNNGEISYLIIPNSSESIETGQKINNDYYIKIFENTTYVDKVGICTVTQSKEDLLYTYQIEFKENIGEFLKKYGTVELSFYLGTQQLKASDLKSYNNSSFIYTLTSSIPLISTTESTITQSIAYQFLRELTYIKMYKDILLTEEIDYSSLHDLNYVLKTNRINTQIFQCSVIDPVFLYDEQITISNKQINVYSKYSSDLQKFKIKIFQNDILIHESKFLYLPEIRYKYDYLTPGEYTIEIQTFDKQNFTKSFFKEIQFSNYESEQVDFVRYDSKEKAHVLYLSNLLSLPWYDFKTSKIWKTLYNDIWKEEIELFNIEETIILNLKASIYRYVLDDFNHIQQQLVLADHIDLEPVWNNPESFSFDHLFYDYGVNNKCKYRYEVFYEADSLLPKDYNISLKETETSSTIFLNLKYYNIDNTIKEIQLTNKENNQRIENVVFSNNQMNFILNGKSIALLFYFTTNNNIENIIAFKGYDNENNIIPDETFSSIEYEAINTSDIKTETVAIVYSDILSIKDWIGVCLYGTNYNYNEEVNNRYELNSQQIWYFDLDTNADSIDVTNERNIFTNLSSIPKVELSNVNYMSQSITTKLGYLNEEDIYVEDNGQKLNKFMEWANDGTIKILKLPNGFLIPVDIALKSSLTNYKVFGEPSNITFTWTQIGDHKTSVLYQLKEGSF